MDQHRIKEVREHLVEREGHLRLDALEAVRSYKAARSAVSLCDELLGETPDRGRDAVALLDE